MTAFPEMYLWCTPQLADEISDDFRDPQAALLITDGRLPSALSGDREKWRGPDECELPLRRYRVVWLGELPDDFSLTNELGPFVAGRAWWVRARTLAASALLVEDDE